MPMSTKVAQGDVAVMKCLAPKGYPEPTTTWFKNGDILDPSSSKRIRVTETGNLVIRDAENSDTGEYFCRAENMVAVRDSDVARLSVHGKFITLGYEYPLSTLLVILCLMIIHGGQRVKLGEQSLNWVDFCVVTLMKSSWFIELKILCQ